MIAPMIGTDANTGQHIEGLAHLRQSIRDILSTRRGTRVMRRAYGSNLPSLIDAPVNGETILDIVAETAEALATWEPRIDLQRVGVDSLEPGRIELTVEGIYRATGETVVIDGIEV